MVRTPTLLQSMVGILISSVSAGCDLNAAVSSAGTVYTWGVGGGRFLGHGDEGCSLVPKQVQALAGHLVLSVTTGGFHCFAVIERGEVFSWGWDRDGQCGHGSSNSQLLLPRSVEAPLPRSVEAPTGRPLTSTRQGWHGLLLG